MKPPSAAILARFKDAMSRLSAQAMILTAGCKSDREILHGMTLSLVCSLSVAPMPLLQFNLHLPSYTSASLHLSKLMCLHLMPPTPKLVFLGRTFASGRKIDRSHFQVSPEDGEIYHEMTTPFAQVDANDYFLHDRQVPVLREAEVAFVCRPEKTFEVDNHELWVVEVLDILQPNQTYASSKSGGLLYYDRGFHGIGRPLNEP